MQLDRENDLMGLRVRPEDDVRMASYRSREKAVKVLRLPQTGQGARPRAGGRGGRWVLSSSKRQGVLPRGGAGTEGGRWGPMASSVSGKSSPSQGLA